MEFSLLFGKVEVAFLEDVWGFCLFNRYCYTSYFGWESLKTLEDA